MINTIIAYDFLEDFGKHNFRLPNLGEEFKDVTRKTDEINYSVNCLTYRKETKKEDAGNVRKSLENEIKNMGYDTLVSLDKKYEENEIKQEKSKFFNFINPFGKNKTKLEKITIIPYVLPLPLAFGIELTASAIGFPLPGVGLTSGLSTHVISVSMIESGRRSKGEASRLENNMIEKILSDPKTLFFSDFLEKNEKIDVNFTAVEPAYDFMEKSVLPSVNFATVHFGKVNEKLLEFYKDYKA